MESKVGLTSNEAAAILRTIKEQSMSAAWREALEFGALALETLDFIGFEVTGKEPAEVLSENGG